jgi:hypothetical protein
LGLQRARRAEQGEERAEECDLSHRSLPSKKLLAASRRRLVSQANVMLDVIHLAWRALSTRAEKSVKQR